MRNPVSTRRVWIARTIAVAVDVLQIAVFPAFVTGFASPLDDGLDVATAIIMIALLGWHVAFVPSFLVKLLPVADLAPTWTIALLIVTRKTPLMPGKLFAERKSQGSEGESV
jgi:hypothetical protein